MRPTQLLALSGLMLASNVVLAAELDREDVPNRCWDVCGPVVGVAHRCDGMNQNDRAEMDCICDWKQAPSLVPLCEACIADYRADRNNPNRDRHYDEEHDLFDDDDDDNDDADDRDPHHNGILHPFHQRSYQLIYLPQTHTISSAPALSPQPRTTPQPRLRL